MTKNTIAKRIRSVSIVLIICFYCLIASNRACEFRTESNDYVHYINSTIRCIKDADKESVNDYKDSIKDCIRELRKMNLMPGWIAYILNPNSYGIIELFNYFN